MTDRRSLLLRAVWVAGVLGALAQVPFAVLGDQDQSTIEGRVPTGVAAT